jgi:hypothetical protein
LPIRAETAKANNNYSDYSQGGKFKLEYLPLGMAKYLINLIETRC